jgi:hypothetical protein
MPCYGWFELLLIFKLIITFPSGIPGGFFLVPYMVLFLCELVTRQAIYKIMEDVFKTVKLKPETMYFDGKMNKNTHTVCVKIIELNLYSKPYKP